MGRCHQAFAHFRPKIHEVEDCMQAPLKEKNDIKIFILYLLKNLNYPLDFNTISDMVVQDEFVSYFDFAECFAELLDTETIEMIRVGDGSNEVGVGENGRPENKNEHFRITENGIVVVEQLQSNLLGVIKEKSLKSAMRLLSFKQRGADVKCTHAKREDGKFDLHCEIIENFEPALEINLVVENEDLLHKMVANFNEHPEVAYRGVISILSGDINYLVN